VVVVGIKSDQALGLSRSDRQGGRNGDRSGAGGRAKLGVKVELLPVIAANRMEFLNQGRIDLIIDTMGDTRAA
jgi:ABC-type amino acid transport substrate-binding protein